MLLTLLFSPSSFILLSFSSDSMYFFPLVRSSCLLSRWYSAYFCIQSCIPDVSVERDLSPVIHLSLPFVSAHYLIGFFISLILSCMSCLYISEINPLLVASLANIFSYSEGCTLNFEHAASSIWTSLPPSISLLALYSSLNISCVFCFWSSFSNIFKLRTNSVKRETFSSYKSNYLSLHILFRKKI